MQVGAERIFDPFEDDRSPENDLTPSEGPAARDPFQEDGGVDPFEVRNAQTEAVQAQRVGMPVDDPFGEDAVLSAPDGIQELDDWTTASISGSQQGLELSADVRSLADDVLELIRSLAENLGASDSGLLHISKKMDAIWTSLLTQCGGSQPQFMFHDGPVVESSILGYQLLMEDFDAPSQAVTERLNSILETERSFRVTENLLMADQPEIGIHRDFQVFATVHQHHSQQPPKLSPAIRSRFTEIAVSGYTANEIKDVVAQELQEALSEPQESSHLVKQLFNLRALTLDQSSSTTDLHRLIRWIRFICNHSKEVSLTRCLLLGVRFCYLLPGESISDQLQASWTGIFGTTTDKNWAAR